ncbi:MAG: UDP-N-acetylmuramoyl-L-alanyl-D-glutamate--2,6-diaminopimelate ligase [Alphaproteobacteria bacterium]|nr:UDP-N-acetylmuramoyl-L-alanyl-D-glutamate--2,6-diaminopimelate ligase [Alphaproteobacteria bacterium]
MLLSRILQGVNFNAADFRDVEISTIEINSQNITPGGLFVAITGHKTDGRQYIPDALKRGAAAIVYGGEYEIPSESKAVIIKAAGNIRDALAKITQNFYNDIPPLISAITGTNGKTSIAEFTRCFMSLLGHSSASIGTIGVVSDVMENIETLTTPDSVTLHKILSNLRQRGVDYVSMEASSAGLEQQRLDNVPIKVAGFTNFTQDHLDYHQNMENYFNAKKLLFSKVMEQSGTAVLNADIGEFAELNDICQSRSIKVLSYGKNGHDLKLNAVAPHARGQVLDIEIMGKKYKVDLPLIGEFQAMNVLCALGMIIGLTGELNQKIIDYLPRLKGAIGRLDCAGVLKNGAGVYVDYAHTPDALENVLKTMRVHTQNRLWVMFGCGGDRDKLKRPIMGKIANDLADFVIVTDDNPRSENPAVIRSEILAQCPKAVEIADRVEAIAFAISHLQSGDMLVLAGKGHESGQKIGDIIIPMNDIDEAKKQIAKY